LVQFIPSKRADVDILIAEFNPFVSKMKKQGAQELHDILTRIWGEETFCFIYRVPRKGLVQYHVAFDQVINV
jgi:hypothetical protein